MKFSIYFDIDPWMTDANSVYPCLSPATTKRINSTRYRIDVEIPDPHKPDVVLEGTPIAIKEDTE